MYPPDDRGLVGAPSLRPYFFLLFFSFLYGFIFFQYSGLGTASAATSETSSYH